RGADATEEGRVVAHRPPSSEHDSFGRNLAWNAGWGLLNVDSGLVASGVACEDNALRVAQPLSSSEPHHVALRERDGSTSPRRQEDQVLSSYRNHPFPVWRQRPRDPLSNRDRWTTIRGSPKDRWLCGSLRSVQRIHENHRPAVR